MESVQANPLKFSCTPLVLPIRPRVESSTCPLNYPPSSPSDSAQRQTSRQSRASPAELDGGRVQFRSEPPKVITNLRFYAAQDLEACQELLASLELNRMRKARIGLRNWICFWERIYKQPLADIIRAYVIRTFLAIDHLFRTIAQQICHITHSTGRRMMKLRTVQEAKSIWRQMEIRILRLRDIRRHRAQALFEKLRLNLEAIPVDVDDWLFDDLKRGVFALDAVGDYHPGDLGAEEWEKEVDGKMQAIEYAAYQPDLPIRPGFSNHFQMALHRASAGYEELNEDDDDTETTTSPSTGSRHPGEDTRTANSALIVSENPEADSETANSASDISEFPEET